MAQEPYYINSEVRRTLGERRTASYQAYAGVDIQAAMYLPLYTKGSALEEDKAKFRLFADIQTISISSTRSISPVRVWGQSSPIAYTKGARTFAGSLVFATLNKDVFSDIYDVDIAEGYLNASTSLVADQLPPFSVILTASNEAGGVAIQVIHGIILVNYGTTYSIDDMYTETVYTYVATDVSPLMPSTLSDYRGRTLAQGNTSFGKTITQSIEESMHQAYSSDFNVFNRVRDQNRKRTTDTGLSF